MLGSGLSLLAAILALSSAGPVYRVSRETASLQEDAGIADLSPYANYTANEVCYQDDEVFERGAVMPNPGPCEQCRCEPPSIVCEMVRCQVNRNGCRTLQRPNHCCPDYNCECDYNGQLYGDGERLELPEEPCQVCYCKGGDVMCTSITCYHRDDCEPLQVPGQCCPKYENCPLRDMAVSDSNNNEVRMANKTNSWPKREMQPWLLTKSAPPTPSAAPGAEEVDATAPIGGPTERLTTDHQESRLQPQDGAKDMVKILNTAAPPDEVIFTRVDHRESQEQVVTLPSLIITGSEDISGRAPSMAVESGEIVESAVEDGEQRIETTTTGYDMVESTTLVVVDDFNDLNLSDVLQNNTKEEISWEKVFGAESGEETSTQVSVDESSMDIFSTDSTTVETTYPEEKTNLSNDRLQTFVGSEKEKGNIKIRTSEVFPETISEHSLNEHDLRSTYETTTMAFDETTEAREDDVLTYEKNNTSLHLKFNENDKLTTVVKEQAEETTVSAKEDSLKNVETTTPAIINNHSGDKSFNGKQTDRNTTQNATDRPEEKDGLQKTLMSTYKLVNDENPYTEKVGELNEKLIETSKMTTAPLVLNESNPTTETNNMLLTKDHTSVDPNAQEESSKLVKILVEKNVGDELKITQDDSTSTTDDTFKITHDLPTRITLLELQDISQEHDLSNSDEHFEASSMVDLGINKEIISNILPILELNSYVPYLQLGGHGGSDSSLEIFVDEEQTTEQVEKVDRENHNVDHTLIYSATTSMENKGQDDEKLAMRTTVSPISEDLKEDKKQDLIEPSNKSSNDPIHDDSESTPIITTTHIPLTPADLKVLAEYLINETIKPPPKANISGNNPNEWLKGNLTSEENMASIINAANISIGIISTTDATETSTRTNEIVRVDKFDKGSLQKGNNILRNLNIAVNKTGYLHNKFNSDEQVKNHLMKTQTESTNIGSTVTPFEGTSSVFEVNNNTSDINNKEKIIDTSQNNKKQNEDAKENIGNGAEKSEEKEQKASVERSERIETPFTDVDAGKPTATSMADQ